MVLEEGGYDMMISMTYLVSDLHFVTVDGMAEVVLVPSHRFIVVNSSTTITTDEEVVEEVEEDCNSLTHLGRQ
jgi:hypothetical protein